jgi:hypothetical protein
MFGGFVEFNLNDAYVFLYLGLSTTFNWGILKFHLKDAYVYLYLGTFQQYLTDIFPKQK